MSPGVTFPTSVDPVSRNEHARELGETVQLLDVGVSIFDDDLNLVFCNPTFRQIFGLNEAQVPLGSPLGPILHRLAENGAYGEVNVEAFVAQLLSTLRTLERPLVIERTVVDGRIFESHTSRLAGGGCLAIHTDITHHKRTQAELRESQQQLSAQSALLKTSIDNMPGAMAVWDSDLRYVLWSKHGEEFFNLPAGTLKVGMHLSEIVRYFAMRGDYGPGDIETLVAEQMRPFYERSSVVIERCMPDGRVIQSRRNPLPDGGYVSVFQDVTAQTALEVELRQAKEQAEAAAEQLRRRQRQIQALLDSSGQGFLSFGKDLRVHEEYSQACLSIFGEAPVGKDITALLFPNNSIAASALRKQLFLILNAKDSVARNFQFPALPKEFHLGERVLQAAFRLLEGGDLMLVLTDVTTERSFMALSNTDRLTGLANRRQLDAHLLNERERANRTLLPMALIIADVDHFKRINDTHGHLTGDRVLTGIAELLRERVRKSDWLGRWGGEEFMVICPYTDSDGAHNLAEELREAISAAEFPELGSLTCSIGTATLRPQESIESLIQRADCALYQAKRDGRNRVCIAP